MDRELNFKLQEQIPATELAKLILLITTYRTIWTQVITLNQEQLNY
jgi:hypothetical protein